MAVSACWPGVSILDAQNHSMLDGTFLPVVWLKVCWNMVELNNFVAMLRAARSKVMTIKTAKVEKILGSSRHIASTRPALCAGACSPM